MAASMNFAPVSDARKVTEKKAAADAQRHEEAAQKAAEAAVYDDQTSAFSCSSSSRELPLVVREASARRQRQPETGERLEGGRPSVGHRAL